MTETPSPAPAAAKAERPRRPRSLAEGIAVLEAVLRTLSSGPGIYRMVDGAGAPLYVGKARNLKARVASYTQVPRLSPRIARMVAETAALEIVTTHTEAEALLLESNLIKRLKPPYNILLRDDKGFPYILLTGADAWPRLLKHRGARTAPGEYFGPYAAAGSIAFTLGALERAFLLRSCSDTIFAGRTRPCLKYQLKRCSAPCVGHIAADAYAALVGQARDFLAGRSQRIQAALAEEMQAASDAMEFERAARLRDRIRALTALQARQTIDVGATGLDKADILALHGEGGASCVQVFFFRGGRNNGDRAYFPRHDKAASNADILAAFIGQFYDNKTPPPEILLSEQVPEQALIAEALAVRAGHAVRLSTPQRGPKRRLVQHALDNARAALGRRLALAATQREMLERLAAAFALAAPPRRIEVYDNSHISGSGAVGAMIVAGPEGFEKNAYRRFTIRNVARPGLPAPDGAIVPGDDYAMLRQVLQRRFGRALKEDPARATWPELALIDGGQGHLNVARAVLDELGVAGVALAAIAKGPDRDAGRERFFLPGRAAMSLEPRDPLLYYLQRLRDEAHRFAIGGHRGKRSRALAENPLDDIPGIGAARKRALLHHFGSARAVSRAGLDDLERVQGISRTVARRVYEHFHGDR